VSSFAGALVHALDLSFAMLWECCGRWAALAVFAFLVLLGR
jgi:hypothetical protein